MAEVAVPSSMSRPSWLDRPVLPAWQRVLELGAHWEVLVYAGLVLAGFLLRIWDVGGRAMHHDESLHAYYSWRLYTGQGYSYDPLMHGPLQFEVVPLFYLLFGANEFSARLLAVVLGTVLIFLPYFLRSFLTRPGALFSAFMLAISPVFVYFSRFIRDDIYLACFSLVVFIAIVHYLEEHKTGYLYLVAAAAALAIASMEAAYINFFIFGSFLFFQGIREKVGKQQGPVLSALKATTLDAWLTATSIFVVLTVLLYSTFFTNPFGIWDAKHPLCLQNCLSLHPVWSSTRKDIMGGVAYWLAQHSVQRGGQPWFYYLLLLPLYEQLAVLFGIAGFVYAAIKRSLTTTFLVWWAVLSLALYSWAGEKMPWLSIHIALPLILLAGLFLGSIVSVRRALLVAASTVFLLLSVLEVHSTFLLNYVDGANPTEMLIYVQTSPDVPRVVKEIAAISRRLPTGTSMGVGLDTNDVGGWPFTWYLRNHQGVTETASFNGPVCHGTYCPVLLMLGPEFDQYGNQLRTRYVVQKYRWNWWFPEDPGYKQWFPQHWSTVLQGRGSLADDLLGTAAERTNLWNWLLYRRPFGERGARWLYFLVRRDLVPGSRYYSSRPTQEPNVLSNKLSTLPSTLISTFGSSGQGPGRLEGPRGVAGGRNGSIYVADTMNHRVVAFWPGGKVRATWGGVGSGRGQFSSNNSPQGLAVGPDGLIYIADTWNQRIQVFSPNGKFIRQWGGGPIGSGPGQFYGPRAVALSKNDHVFVADTGNERIQVFNKRGRYLYAFGAGGTAPGQFQEPSSVAVARDGTVYVSDFWNRRIQAFTPSGRYLRSWAVSDWAPHSYDEPYLAIDEQTGQVLASDPMQHQVLAFTRLGRPLGSLGAARLSDPIGVATGPRELVVVSDAQTNQIELFRVQKGNSRRAGASVSIKPHR